MTLIDRESAPRSYERSGETLAVGEVRELSIELVTDEKGRSYIERLVEVGDENDPVEAAELRRIGDEFEAELKAHPEWKPTIIEPANPKKGTEAVVRIDPDNKAAVWLYLNDPTQPSMVEWAKLFPSAKALFPLQRIEEGHRVLTDDYQDERSKYLFRNMIDGIGLRARARVYTDILTERAQEFEEDELVCVSIGSGAAVPNLLATTAIRDRTGKSVKWRMIDPNENALNFAEELSQEGGFPGGMIEKHVQSYLSAEQLGDIPADIIDVLGLWEYLKPPLCRRMLKDGYSLLKPGGTFICSNMLKDRPQNLFNEKAVGWPYLQKRFETDMLDITDSAGIDSEQVTITRSLDNVYMVMEVRKPWY